MERRTNFNNQGGYKGGYNQGGFQQSTGGRRPNGGQQQQYTSQRSQGGQGKFQG